VAARVETAPRAACLRFGNGFDNIDRGNGCLGTSNATGGSGGMGSSGGVGGNATATSDAIGATSITSSLAFGAPTGVGPLNQPADY
jgi:hypothetical protein